MKLHYTRLHWKRKINLLDLHLLSCKCSEVPKRGKDNTIRNGHHHCPICHKPCDQSKPLTVHMVSHHKVGADIVKHL